VTEYEGVASSRLAQILVSNNGKIRAYLLARGAGDVVDDVLQEMWIRASRIDRPVEPSPLSYLFRMAEHLLLDIWRQGNRRSMREAQWSEAYQELHEVSAESHVLANQKVGIVVGRLAAMGARVEHVFRRYRLDGVEQRLIAEELGVSLSTVEKDLRKAYTALLKVGRDFDAV